MSSKALVATVIGGIVNFILGYVIYDLLLGNFYGSHSGGSSVMREIPEMWAIGLGCLAYAATLALVFDRWAGIKTIRTGAQAGAWIRFEAAEARHEAGSAREGTCNHGTDYKFVP